MNSPTGKLSVGCLEKYCERRHGRLSLRNGEGEVEGFSRAIGERNPTLTQALSPSARGEADFF